MDRAPGRYRSCRDRTPDDKSEPATPILPQKGGLASMVALTLTNPPTILSFSAVFAGLGLRVEAGWLPAIGRVVGVMLVSALGWVVMTGLVSALRDRGTAAIHHAMCQSAVLDKIWHGW